jgi:hypothetical protein
VLYVPNHDTYLNKKNDDTHLEFALMKFHVCISCSVVGIRHDILFLSKRIQAFLMLGLSSYCNPVF